MIKFTGDGKNGRVFFLGLSRGNIDRLTSGQPIKVNLSDLGGPPVEVVILFEETEQILFDKLKAAGMIPEDVRFTPAEPGEVRVTRVQRSM